MNESIQFTFRTSRDTNRVVSVSEPRAVVNEIAARTAADLIMAANPFDAETGQLVGLRSVQRVQVSSQVIIAPPVA